MSFSSDVAPLLNADSPTAIEGEYIVVFKREMQDEDRMCMVYLRNL